MKRQIVLFVSSLFWSSAMSNSCTTPLEAASNCISLYDCPQLRDAFEQRPLPPQVVSFLRQSQCGFEGYTPKVCCGPLAETNSPNTPPTEQSSRPIQNEVNSGQTEPASEEDSNPAPRNTCRKDTTGDKIFGPLNWMSFHGWRYWDIEQGNVRLGEYDTQKEVDCLDGTCADPPQEIPIHVAYPHPGYSDKKKKDDIGLLRLARRATYSYYVQPICLVSSNECLEVGMDVFVAGWVKTLDGKNNAVKLKLSMPIFNKDECDKKYLISGVVLTEKHICAGGVFAQDTG